MSMSEFIDKQEIDSLRNKLQKNEHKFKELKNKISNLKMQNSKNESKEIILNEEHNSELREENQRLQAQIQQQKEMISSLNKNSDQSILIKRLEDANTQLRETDLLRILNLLKKKRNCRAKLLSKKKKILIMPK